MSLQVLAQDMASRGRGPDTMLVHMAPKEVAGLQALALAHGGSLTINPHTGLPEAGFLSSILPMVAGMALNTFMPGVGTAIGSALGGIGGAAGTGVLVGGLTGLATGSLRKGLMAGLGAYGGAGIGNVIGNAGSAAIEAGVPAAAPIAPVAPVSPVAATPVSPVAPVTPVAPVAPAAAPVSPVTLPEPAYIKGMVDPMGGFPATTVPVPANGAYTVDPMGGLSGATAAPQTALPTASPAAQTYPVDPATLERGYMNQMDLADEAARAARETAARNYTNQMDIASDLRAPKEAALREAGPTGRFSKGLGAIADKPSLLFNKENLKYGAAALAPLMFQEAKNTQVPRDTEQYRYTYSPGRATPPTRAGDVGEYTYFRPSYTRLAAGGGLMDLPVERMSDRNEAETMMANGGQMYADGGEVANPTYTYDPITRTYKDMSKVQPVTTVTQMPGVSSRQPYYDNSLGGEGPTPPNPDFMYDPNTGQLTPVVSALASIGNALNINSPQQGVIMGLPGLVMGNPLGILAGAAVGNAVQGANMLSLHNSMVEANGGKPVQGLPTPGQSGFVAGLPGAMAQMTSNASSQVNDEINASLAANAAANANAADSEDAAMGQAIADAALSDAVVASDASSGPAAADGGGGGGGGVDYARGGLSVAYARGGYNLGDYSDGGRLLRGPGDGVSDSIPASIANKRPARLADGEFVVPARIVSELGNGSTEAGARKLYAMMDRVQKNRAKTVGKGKVAVNSRSEKLLPA